MGLSGFAVSPHTGARLETLQPSRLFAPGHDAPHTGARLETTTLLYRKAHFRPILGDFAASLLLNKRAKRQNISAAYLI